MNRRQRCYTRILFVLYLIVLAWLCFGHFDSIPDVPKSYWGIPTDKIVHFLMFFPFPVLAVMTLDIQGKRKGTAALIILAVFLTGAALAACTEVAQTKLTTWRKGDPTDFGADLLALGLGSLLVLGATLWKHRK